MIMFEGEIYLDLIRWVQHKIWIDFLKGAIAYDDSDSDSDASTSDYHGIFPPWITDNMMLTLSGLLSSGTCRQLVPRYSLADTEVLSIVVGFLGNFNDFEDTGWTS